MFARTYVAVNNAADNVRCQESADISSRVCEAVKGAGVLWCERDMIHLIAGVNGAVKRTHAGKHEHHSQAVASGPNGTDEAQTWTDRGDRVPELEGRQRG